MDIQRTAVDEFWTGNGGADAVARPIVQPGYAPETVLKGVRVRAATGNNLVIYVGRRGVAVGAGYPLPAGEELLVEINDVSAVYVIADPVGNSQQVVTLAGTVPGETFVLHLEDGATDPIAVDAMAATVKTALEEVVGAGNVDVAGDAGGPYTVEFQGALAKQDVPLMTADDGGQNEKQTITFTNVDGGTFKATFGGQQTGDLAYDMSTADLQVALRALTSINGPNVTVTGAPGAWVVEFIGTLALTDVGAISIDDTNLTGEGKAVDVTETQKGDASFTIAITKTDASANSRFSWIAS